MNADRIEKQIILVIDDTPENIILMKDILSPAYKIKAATSGKKGIDIATNQPRPDLILLDVMMPDMDGYEVCRQLKKNPKTFHIPIIFVTALSQERDERKGFDLGAVDFITKPISAPILEARVRTHIALHNQNVELNRRVEQRTAELNKTRLQIIHRLGRATEFKDNETGLHVIRMSHYARILAEKMRAGQEWVDLIFNASPMHDIGKIGIPEHILMKPDKLSAEERQIMQKHPEIGASIIGEPDSELLQMCREIALTHHERWDGKGYPYGLKGEQIPLSGRIAAIADVFDALTMLRPYKDPWSVDKTVAYFNQQSGRQFDPELIDLFNQVIPQFVTILDNHDDAARLNQMSKL